MGMNFQDVIRDVHDSANHALNISGTISASGQTTIVPLQAWPDPKGYIGLVTITGSLAPAAGNVTLDPGSRTGIVGNITLSDPKGFIGLVTVVGSLSPASGNVTLDPGSRTGIVGNVTLTDSKTYIGLTTTTLGAGTAAIGKLAANSGVDIGDVDVTSLPNGLLDSFGHIVTAEINNDVDVQFYRATSDADLSNIITETEANGGTATKSNGMATFATTTTASSRAKGVSLVPVVYTAGAEVYAIFTAAFPAATGGTGSYRRIGLYNDLTDGLFIGYETDGTFGISIVKGGSQVTTLKANFSEDTLVGGAGSKFTRDGTPEAIDLTKLNVFRIRFGWVGSAPIKFEVLSPDGNWVLFHTILQPNLAAVPSLNTADLYFTCDVFTGTSGEAQSILTNCWGAGTTQKLRKLTDTLTGNTLAGLTRSVITGVTTGGGGTYVNVKVNPSGALTADVTGTVGVTGNVTLSDSKGFIGLTTVVQASSARTITGNVTLSDSKGFIGLVTVVQSSTARTITGNVTLDAGSRTGIIGNVTLSDPKGFIGLVTVGNTVNTAFSGNVTLDAGSKTQIVGNITLSDPKGFIGLVTVVGSLSAAAGNITLDPGSRTGIVGNVTLSDPKGFIGLVTIGGGTLGTSFSGNITLDAGSKTQIVGNVTLSDPKGFIGLVTVVQGSSARTITGNITLDVGSLVGIRGNVTITDGKTFIGLVTVVQSSAARTITGNLTLSDSKGFIGLVTVVQGSTARTITGNVTLSDAKTFIGLVTAQSLNAGTTKTLIPLPIGLGNNSLSTVAVPTNAQRIKVTHLILNSNITTEVALKSGVTYLTGNASLGITLFPGGGFDMPGSPDSPVWISLPSGAFVVEKRDPGGTVSKIGGSVIYFDE